MNNSTRHTDYYQLRRFTIIRETQDEVDIASLIPEFHITESMDNDSIRGSAQVIDKAGLLESLPLRGEERLLIEVSDAENIVHKYDMFIYNIDNVDVLPSNDGLSYWISFVSFSRFLSSQKKICRSYNAHIHEIVKDIFDESFNIHNFGYKDIIKDYGKLSDTSATDSLQHIIIPNMAPHQAIDFLTRRAYSSTSDSSSFRFFENTDGYHFIHDEDAFTRSKEPMTLTYYDSAKNDGASFKQMRHNLIDLQNNKRVNTADDIYSGGYRNDVVEIDIVKKEVVTKSYNHIDNILDFDRPSGIRTTSHHTMDFSRRFFNDENARKLMTIKTNKDDNLGSLDPNDNMSELISKKIAYRYHLDKMQITAISPGHLNLTCGHLVDLEIYQMLGERKSPTINEQMSGLYLVRSIDRNFVHDNYRDTMVLSKSTWEDREAEMPGLSFTI